MPEEESCNSFACRAARVAFQQKRLAFETKKAAHDEACKTKAKWEGRLISFLMWVAGIATTVGAGFIATGVTIALKAVAVGAGVAGAGPGGPAVLVAQPRRLPDVLVSAGRGDRARPRQRRLDRVVGRQQIG